MNQPATEGAVSVIDYVIGENVATLQRRAGMTNSTLGAHFGVSGSAMSLKLHGKRAWSALDVQRAAALFGVRMAQLNGEEPLPEPTTPATVTEISEMLGRRQPKSPLSDYSGDDSASAPVLDIFTGREVGESVGHEAVLA